mmetsp:Transcript_9678/g.35206  ORF Transcript_9678/g.35206 Transcript_9678/m.35206 type:complete len:243 (-) Transcript_9678:300-1028(-)
MSELFPTPDGPARTVTPSFRSPALVPSSSPPPPSSSPSPSPLVVVARVFSLDASSRSSASIPSPVATDTNRGRYPHCSNLASQSARASALTRSHLFSTSVNGTFVCSMDTRNRVSCFGSSGGRSSAKTSSAWSTLATGGSSSVDERAWTCSTTARPSTQSIVLTSTPSPTRTRCLIFFRSARTTHRSSCGPWSALRRSRRATSSSRRAAEARAMASSNCASRSERLAGVIASGLTTTRRKLA